MKKHRLLFLTFGIVLFFLTGCHTMGYVKSDQTVYYGESSKVPFSQSHAQTYDYPYGPYNVYPYPSPHAYAPYPYYYSYYNPYYYYPYYPTYSFGLFYYPYPFVGLHYRYHHHGATVSPPPKRRFQTNGGSGSSSGSGGRTFKK